MKTPREILIAARELIADPARWTQGNYAEDADGCAVDATDPAAYCRCALGALRTVGGVNRDEGDAYDALNAANGGDFVCTFNDTHTHAEVLAMFDRAIAATEVQS